MTLSYNSSLTEQKVFDMLNLSNDEITEGDIVLTSDNKKYIFVRYNSRTATVLDQDLNEKEVGKLVFKVAKF